MVIDYQGFTEFKAKLLAGYKDRIRDIKANFILANPNLIRLDWSFMSKISVEAQADEPTVIIDDGVEGKVTGGGQVLKDNVEVPEDAETIIRPSTIE